MNARWEYRKKTSSGVNRMKLSLFDFSTIGNSALKADMMLGVTCKARFRTGWRIDAGQTAPRFVTAYRIGVNKK